MLNRTTADLASATVRTRYFQGRAAEEVAEDMPILPVDAPALPPPGPSFVRTAKLLGDPQPKQEFTKGGKPKKITGYRPHGPYLTALVRACLYQTGTVIPVGPDDAHSEAFAFLPGLMMTGGADGTDLYGPGPCRLMVVGRYPGLSEVEQGRHFVGKGSEYLWQAWREAGIAKPSKEFPVFCTNLARFTPPLSMKDRLPKEVVQDGRHLLYQEIAVCRPEVVLVLGAEALKSLYGTSAKISDYAGRTATLQIDCRPDENTPSDLHAATVIVADHPAKVLRDPDAYPQFLASIRKAAQVLGFADKAKDVKKDYQKVLTLSELKAAVLESEKASAHGGYVSFDCEWEGKHPSDPDYYLYTVQWSHAPGHARVVFLRHCGGAPNASLPIDLARPWLRRLFEKAPDRGARLVAHFGKADLPGLHSIGVNLYDKFVGPDHDDQSDQDALEAGDKTYYEGGFDTYVAGHAVDESAALKLELLVANRLGIDRYDTDVIAWRESYCREKKIKRSQLKGYGNCPENLIFHYGGADADYTGRLYLHYNGDPRTGTRGVLDCDQFGNSSRKIFGLRMRAWGAWAEMERYGLEVDRYQHRVLREQIVARREELLAEFRQKAQWEAGPNDAEGFSPTKTRHKVEFLFGEQYSKDGKPIRPPGALSLYLKPYKSTKASGGRLWDEALWRAHKGNLPDPVPAADKETTVILSRQHPLVALLKDIDLLTTAMKIMFRLPVETDEEEEEFDGGLVEYEQDPEDEVHDRGFVSLIDHDGRIRSVFGIVETGRASSSRPNLQNQSESTDEQYDRILQQGASADGKAPAEIKARHFRTKSVMRAQSGWFLVTADLMGAEIAAAGWSCGDPLLVEHARRATLPADHPDVLDLHSDLAKSAFRLECSLKDVKKLHKSKRTGAKRARFGHYYGASPDSIYRKALEDDPNVTLEDIVALVKNHDQIYPVLANHFAVTRKRVTTHGWFKNGYGGNRRFRPATDRERVAGQEREAQNWLCQGLVADNITSALGNCWYEFRKRKMLSRIVLSIHDSIMVEAPAHEVATVVDEVLPLCMSHGNPVPISDLDGNPVNRGPYYFGIDTAVYRSWGVEVEESDWRKACEEANAKIRNGR
jgi:uracil-DNA glycosylase family 4